jgi:hypothetical protein
MSLTRAKQLSRVESSSDSFRDLVLFVFEATRLCMTGESCEYVPLGPIVVHDLLLISSYKTSTRRKCDAPQDELK